VDTVNLLMTAICNNSMTTATYLSNRMCISRGSIQHSLKHSLQQRVNLVLATAEVAAIDEVVVFLAPAAIGRVELEVPQEVGGLLEVGTYCVDLVD